MNADVVIPPEECPDCEGQPIWQAHPGLYAELDTLAKHLERTCSHPSCIHARELHQLIERITAHRDSHNVDLVRAEQEQPVRPDPGKVTVYGG